MEAMIMNTSAAIEIANNAITNKIIKGGKIKNTQIDGTPATSETINSVN
jgi:hypothetical protein